MTDQTTPERRSVRMSEEEAWAMLDRSLVGILTTLRRDGRPVALPVWYVVLDHRIYVSTRGKKVVRARHDPRASFLVEAGDRWAELRAVHVDCRATLLDPDAELAGRVRTAIDTKYGPYRTPAADMPAATRDHYARALGAVLELVPEGRFLTWDNRHLGLS
jgi:nitroimidazol reductase NimA-like FMN-containing flavoprotein (pyridoxamine 5'-phosphate oxidase superfamily)